MSYLHRFLLHSLSTAFPFFFFLFQFIVSSKYTKKFQIINQKKKIKIKITRAAKKWEFNLILSFVIRDEYYMAIKIKLNFSHSNKNYKLVLQIDGHFEILILCELA